MKYIITLLAFFHFVFLACNTTEKSAAILNTGNLTLQTFEVNTKHDTSIVTKDGLKIRIEAGAIESASEIVTLEIREAISLEEMMKAGLTTQSGKNILSSDGMFYINTKEKSVIKKSLEISVPAEYTDDRMQLYRGEEEDGKINWKDPEPVASMQTAITDSGKILFQNNCGSCHSIDKQLTGPALAWVDKRKSRDWLFAFTRNNQRLIKDGDSYACCIYKSYNKTPMNLFNNLSDKDLNEIYNYVDKETRRLNVPENFGRTICDSCISFSNSVLQFDTGYNAGNFPSDSVGADSRKNFDSQYDYYIVTINTYGWYNIDCMIEKFKTEKSNLIVNIQAPVDLDITSVFLIIPSLKVLANGSSVHDNKTFVFKDDNGDVELPLSTYAYIMAIGQNDNRFYYKQKRFLIGNKQIISMDLIEAKQENIYRSFELLGINGMNIQIDKLSYQTSSNIMDSLIEYNRDDSLFFSDGTDITDTSLKDSPCDCSFGK